MNIRHRPNALAFPNRRSFLGLAGLALMGAGLSGCTRRSVSYRYKLTLSLNTPDGVKTGSVIHEFTYAQVYSLLDGEVYPSSFRGEALFVDLGPGRKPLIATLTGRCQKKDYPFCIGQDVVEANWRGAATYFFAERWDHITKGNPQWLDEIPKWKAEHAHLDLTPKDLPELVTFDDINDATTLRLVDPFHLEQVLGPGISWNAMTIEVVDASLIYSLDKKLPWFAKLFEQQRKVNRSVNLDGSYLGSSSSPNTISLLNHFNVNSFQTTWRPDDGN